ncbi:MAG TPA: DEAD/DEAH box helicase [Solirubrobacteraceae bacterium]|nr:DEAD/DEAH box helicase [Solirubrobacteraceae bacterium]
MAADLTAEELQEASADPEKLAARPFEILQGAANLLACAEGSAQELVARQVIIQCREHRDALPAPLTDVIDALVRELGLFPYLDGDDLDDAALLSRETLRLADLSDGSVVLHAAQAGVYARLLAGDNVILSAPTSFGKSLVIDAVLASGKFDNVLVVVPTLALIDEMRRRLASRKTGHKVITHPTQPHGEHNVFVLTAERVLEVETLPNIDLFVLDEFYKLADGDERGQILNQVFYDVRKRGIQYYLLGPNVASLADAVPAALHDEFVRSDDTTVALRFHDVASNGDRKAALARLAERLERMTLIYCQSPDSAHRTARELLVAGFAPEVPELASAAGWVADHFHPSWVLVEALRHGIGIHHGQLPRALGQFMVKAFEDGRVRWLIATGTLIEGVNTHARHVVLYDNKRPGNRKMNEFSFRNISGRCGRMFHHFSGDVWLFGKRPVEQLPEVDIPILSQGEEVPTSLLQHLDDDDLTDSSRKRLDHFEQQEELSPKTLRLNAGLALEGQLALARRIGSAPDHYHAALGFTQMPEYGQLEVICELLWEAFGGLMSSYTRTYKQLTRQLMNFSIQGSAKALIDEAVAKQPNADIDSLVKDVCYFVRNIAGYVFPVRLRALDRIQEEVFTKIGRQPGNYASYVARVEGLFLDVPLVALDEYGVPPELAQKLRAELRRAGDLDAVLKRLDPKNLSVTPFEAELLRYAQAGL